MDNVDDFTKSGREIGDLYARLGIANSNGAPESVNPAKWLADAFNGKPDHPSFYGRHQHDAGIVLEEEYAKMHGAKFALATSSGEAAISLAL